MMLVSDRPRRWKRETLPGSLWAATFKESVLYFFPSGTGWIHVTLPFVPLLQLDKIALSVDLKAA